MKLWEITGAGAPFTIEAPNLAVAAVAVLTLEEGLRGGWLGVHRLGAHDAGQKMGIFRIPESRELWCSSIFGCDVNSLKKRVARIYVGELSHALGSVERGRPGERNVPISRHDLEALGEYAAKKVSETAVKRTRLPKKPTVH